MNRDTEKLLEKALAHLRLIVVEHNAGESRYLRWEVEAAQEFLKGLGIGDD